MSRCSATQTAPSAGSWTASNSRTGVGAFESDPRGTTRAVPRYSARHWRQPRRRESPTTSTPAIRRLGQLPEDPSNLLADINALIGIETVHHLLPDPTPWREPGHQSMIDLAPSARPTSTTFPRRCRHLALPVQTAVLLGISRAGRLVRPVCDPVRRLGAMATPVIRGAASKVNGIEPIGVAGPWTVDATGQLVGVRRSRLCSRNVIRCRCWPRMEYAAVQTFVGPNQRPARDAGQVAAADVVR